MVRAGGAKVPTLVRTCSQCEVSNFSIEADAGTQMNVA